MDWKFARRVGWRALVILLALELVFSGLNLGSAAGQLSIYNRLVPGRARFPFGENPAQSYNVSVYNLNALFATHEIDGQRSKPADEYRVLLIGDSSIWGTLLRPEETLAGQLETLGLPAQPGKHMRFYNLGYPTMSVLKDVLILQRAVQYQPDLILWSVTLESLVQANQTNSPLVTHNLEAAQALAQQYDLPLDLPAETLSQGILAQRRDLADLARLQVYGLLWAATGRDQYYPPVLSLAQRDFEPDVSYHNLTAPLKPSDLALDTLRAGFAAAGDTPVLLVNEPVMLSSGENSDIRYNFYYPRWAYDDYQFILAQEAAQNNWLYLDLWDQIYESEFTNTAVHLSPFGVSQQAALMSGALPEVARTGQLPALAAQPVDTVVSSNAAEAPETGPQTQANPLSRSPARCQKNRSRSPPSSCRPTRRNKQKQPRAPPRKLVLPPARQPPPGPPPAPTRTTGSRCRCCPGMFRSARWRSTAAGCKPAAAAPMRSRSSATARACRRFSWACLKSPKNITWAVSTPISSLPSTTSTVLSTARVWPAWAG
jgi:hypothetical protein